MIVVTVSRRPLSEGNVASNVLKHGCGALNIEASRIKYDKGEVDFDRVQRQQHSGGSIDGAFGASALVGTEIATYKASGRWPANLILQHQPECLPDGVCTPECPVRDLDAQSGASTSSGGRAYQNTNDMYSGGWAHKGAGVAVDPGYGDTGGASRYFKRVKGERMTPPDDLLQYLTALITPTHLPDGDSLVALDLDAVDWASIPDAKYHGIIARGEPTEEQTGHMWRVVKPGAHVLLIAPETRPTGHVGACALEDRGFEIRDAILWVTEAGRLHYVPKANTRERNAGCEVIAERRKGIPIFDIRNPDDEDAVSELMDALVEGGVPSELVDALPDNGISGDKLPEDFHKHPGLKKRAKSAKYGNFHPTVKSKDIMVRLLADVPEGATVLDPFLGSGSTGLACLETGHDFIGIEREAEYLEIADARVRYADMAKSGWVASTIESDVPKREDGVVAATSEDGDALDLFG